jgi:hypothetical protein
MHTRFFGGETEEHKHRWYDNVNMDLKEMKWGDMNWICLAEDKGLVASSCEHSNELLGSTECGEFCDWLSNF